MSNAYGIAIEPSSSIFQRLEFINVISQVQDFLKILQGDNRQLKWEIISASISSPLQFEFVPFDARSGEPDYAAVQNQDEMISSVFTEMQSGRRWDQVAPTPVVDIIKEMLKRNMNGIESTKYTLASSGSAVKLSQDDAERYLSLLPAIDTSIFTPLMGSLARTELGSIEGFITEIASHYKKPAVRIKERVVGRDVWCQVAESVLEKLASKIKAKHAWLSIRVRVDGEIVYDSDGNIARLQNGNIEFVNTTDVPLDSLYDPNFTEGLPILEYLNRLREGDL